MKHLATIFKVAATVALFWFVLSRVDLAELVSKLNAVDIALALLAGGAIMSLQAALLAVRLRICARAVGHDVARHTAWVACQYGGLFSHTPISFVGGDALRIWHLVKNGLPVQDAAKAVVVDRALGFMGIMFLVIATAPALRSAVKDPVMWSGHLLLIGVGVGATLAFLALGRIRPARRVGGVLGWIAELATASHHLSAKPIDALKAFALAIFVNALNAVAIWAISTAYGGGISFLTALVASPVVFLISMIPISAAGWGLREGAFVVAFGLFGISAAVSLTASITFGIALLLAYSPAAVLIFLARRQGASAAKVEEYAPASSLPPGRS